MKKHYALPWFGIFCLMLLSGLPLSGRSQSRTQVIRGTVINADQLRPLAGASVIVDGGAFGTTADDQGRFRMPNVPVGRHQLSVSFVGYEPTVINELLVESGKEQVLEIRLRPGSTQLGEATVKGSRSDRGISAESITTEQVLRFPATYLDPARLATAYAGVVNTNDQANNISVRGNSPSGLIWRLEGVEIVNPNHLSNAGTIGDRPTASGGGVNILSAQLLGTTRFLTGAFSAEYGNTTAGVLDMSLRAGNNERHEFTAQAGLIGLDLATEGPLSKKNGSSYLVNYRYSFTGLLGLMGISFGGEDIRFQDLSFNLTFPNRKGGRLTLFGVGGASSNDFTARPVAEQVDDKDRYNIFYKSRMGATGLTFSQPLGKRWLWRSVLTLSANRNDRDQTLTVPTTSENTYQYDYNANRRSTWFNALSFRLNEKHRFSAGLYVTRWYGVQVALLGDSTIKARFLPVVREEKETRAWLIEPYAEYQWQPTTQLTVNAGLHYNRFTLNRASRSLEPRASVRWGFLPGQSFSLAYGRHSQTQQPNVYASPFFYGWDIPPNHYVGFTKANHWVLNYTRQLSNASYLKAEAYWQQLSEVPITNPTTGTPFSAINQIDLYAPTQMLVTWINQGKGRNRGVELTYQKYLSKSYYMLASGSLYDSQYQLLNGVWRNTRFNGKYTLNLTGGKEFHAVRKRADRTWGINGRVAYLGGFRDRPIDAARSQQAGTTVYSSEDYSIKLPDYFRMDVRVYWRKSKAKYSRMLSLDLQNALNTQNVAYSYYDALQNKVVRQFQLGTLPILNYRWEF